MVYTCIVRQFVEFLPSESLAEITPSTVRAFMAYQNSRNLSARTLDLTLPALKALFSFLGIAGVVEANPLRFMRRKPAARRMPYVPTVNEVSRIIDGRHSSPVSQDAPPKAGKATCVPGGVCRNVRPRPDLHRGYRAR